MLYSRLGSRVLRSDFILVGEERKEKDMYLLSEQICTKHWTDCFMYNISFNPPPNSCEAWIIIPILQMRKLSLESLSMVM